MKKSYLIIVILLCCGCTHDHSFEYVLHTPSHNAKNTITKDNNDASFYQISHHWILSKRRNKSGSKEMDYVYKDSKIVTHFETSGFFRTYDVIEIKDKNGYKRTMALRAIGQWDIYNNEDIVLHFTSKDTTKKVEFYHIEQLTDTKLVLRNLNRDVYIEYKRDTNKG